MTEHNIGSAEDNTNSEGALPVTRTGRKLLYCLLGMGAVLVASFAVIYWQQSAVKQLNSQYETLRHEISANTRELALAKPLLQHLARAIVDQDATTVQALQEKLNDMQQQLTKLQVATTGDSNESWPLLAIEYRIHLASIKLNQEDDVLSAVQLLNAVAKELASANDPALTPLSQALDEDLLVLNTLTPRDRAGTLLKLRSISKELDSLPFVAIAAESDDGNSNGKGGSGKTKDAVAAPAASEGAGDWRTYLTNSLAKLFEMVRIRKHDTPLGPLLAPSQERLIVQNMQLMLTETEIALLQKNAAVYQAEIVDLQQWLRAYFASGDKRVQAIASQLAELATYDFSSYPTDLRKSLAAITVITKGK